MCVRVCEIALFGQRPARGWCLLELFSVYLARVYSGMDASMVTVADAVFKITWLVHMV